MIDRILTSSDTDKLKTLYEADKAFDESMTSLINWLQSAIATKYLTKDKAIKIFNEELKARRSHES